jgi:hypothetical protein
MITEQIRVLDGISARLGLPMLETLMYMGSNSQEFTLAELRAYFAVRAQFEKLFEPA